MNMKHYKPLAWMMAIAIATLSLPMTACSNDDETVADSRQPEPSAKLCVYGIQHTETRGSAAGAVFTDDDIEWFDVNTRELRFRPSMEPLREKLSFLAGIDFYLEGQFLFSGGATYVGLICSQVFDDLVLCCGKIDGEVIDDGRYYLYDCYPLQFIDTDEVKANRLRRASQWETFLKYLESKGKLK
jgi:hypothetical protein